MKYSQEYAQQQPHEEFLHLSKKEGNKNVSLGTKHLQILYDEVGERVNYGTNLKEKVIWYHFKDLETSQLVKYGVPIKNKRGEINYLINKLAPLKENSYVDLTYTPKEKGFGGYINVEPVAKLNEPERDAQKTIVKKEIPVGEPETKDIKQSKVVKDDYLTEGELENGIDLKDIQFGD